jgi:hypothetical protein
MASAQSKTPTFTDAWARAGRRYTPSAKTDIRETFARLKKEQASRSGPARRRS